ncbi:MAG: hypothetical protein GY754_18255 [bacterium]|nr:hypothetical protein [bacterium]
MGFLIGKAMEINRGLFVKSLPDKLLSEEVDQPECQLCLEQYLGRVDIPNYVFLFIKARPFMLIGALGD